jgi:superfamily I DNA and/or RNA helicase
MMLRAANLVFATTNSYAIERLIEERGLFDWTIVEEAGKATGGELLSPLLLSHRRLMIGDHKQLPASVRSGQNLEASWVDGKSARRSLTR